MSRLLACILVVFLALSGMGLRLLYTSRVLPKPTASPSVIEPDLLGQIDACCREVRERLHPSPDRHTPWELVHALLAWGPDCPVSSAGEPEVTKLADCLLRRPLFLGSSFYDLDHAGIRVRRETGRNRFESHANEFLAIYALAGVPSDAPIHLPGQRVFRVGDLLETAQREYYPGQLPTFLLIAASLYESGLDTTWSDRSGNPRTTMDLVAAQCALAGSDQPCGGTHGYLALAVAWNQLRDHDNGSALPADPRMRLEAILRAEWKRCLHYQRGDGSLSPECFGLTHQGSLGQAIFVTGHTMEWVAEFGDPAILRSEACQACVRFLLRALRTEESCTQVSVGDIGHAVRALRRYKHHLEVAGSGALSRPEPRTRKGERAP